jgi:hypothetical protein
MERTLEYELDTIFIFQHKRGVLFKHPKLCIPWSSFRLNLIRELYSEGLGRDFEVDKSKALVD